MELTRRRLLAGSAGGLAAVGGGVATYNVVLGYDRFTGTNLTIQDLEALVLADLAASGGQELGGHRIRTDGDRLSVDDGAAELHLDREGPADAAAVDEEFGLDGSLRELVVDLGSIAAEEVEVVPASYPEFFDRLRTARTRPATVEALRGAGVRSVDPALVESFAGTASTEPRSLVEGLAEGFREFSYYDVPRYLAGSVQDNVIFGRRDLRARFESPADFESLAAGENDGLFCTELTRRAMEAFHAAPASEQRVPTFTGYVHDARHKHVFLLIGSVVRENGATTMPVTFVDYTYSTLYDDLRLRWALGEGIDAYTSRHRGDRIRWYD